MKTIVIIGIIGIFILVSAIFLLLRPPPLAETQLEPITIALGSSEYSSLTLVADEKGYFRNYGLNVTIRNYSSGVEALGELLAGKADFANAAEFVGVGTGFKSPDIRIIAITSKSDSIGLVAKNNSGILKPVNLNGKTISVTRGTAAEFFLGRYLNANGIDVRNVTFNYLLPPDVVKSIVNGESDSATIWEPYLYQIEEQIGRNITKWSTQGGQQLYWVTYTRADVIQKKSWVIRQYLRAISDSKLFADTHEQDTKDLIKRRLNATDNYINRLWESTRFVLSLDQGLVIAMEDEARWMAEQNMTAGKDAPNFLDMIYDDALREVKPSAVTIIR